MEREKIGRSKARALVAENKDAGAVILCEDTGWTIRLVIGESELCVTPNDSGQTTWQSVDDCLTFVGELGVDSIDLQVDQSDDIGADPEYDDWIRKEVQLAIDDPAPPFRPRKLKNVLQRSKLS
ncbi:hypothetical protein [Massilia cavernae]|uniref:Uncharacterized protein n=1 Tax=Massilia cavernae TaxID=2320864 RepID=A0A418XW22_9BURK|nr:hypothetical protein [Massilia cavernae]RJG16972.1 hypothetical protein D3872_10570 [Massilia cavernae]